MTNDNNSDNLGVVARCSVGLTGAQRRYLRGLGHHLNPVVQVGARGVHDALLEQIERALLDHELIKVKLHGADGDERDAAAEALHAHTRAHVVQVLGRTVLLYKARDEDPTIRLPKGGARP